MTLEEAQGLVGHLVAINPHGVPVFWVGKVRAITDAPSLLLEHDDGSTQLVPLAVIKQYLSNSELEVS